MKKTVIAVLSIFWISLVKCYSQNSDVCLSNEEMKLYQLINEYRKKNNLPAIPLSASLCKVAQLHVKDLSENKPVKDNCNMHSWSDKGSWKACCYTPDHKEAKCMWDKPKEIAGYNSAGYEISHGGPEGYKATAESSLEGWKNSKNHNNVILNKDIWKDSKWQAIGVGIYKEYAVVWFGELRDTKPTPVLCK